MKTHKLLPHTADVRLWVESDTLKGLFEASLEGMAGLMKRTEIEKKGPVVAQKIDLDAPDLTALLIDFLSAVLTLCHEKKSLFTEVEFSELDSTRLKGIVKGIKVDGFDEDIKAVTYHEAEIRKNNTGYLETMIVFDV
jgi:SHS2 domain-containing protein